METRRCFYQRGRAEAGTTLIANTIYKENYQTTSMEHSWVESDIERIVEYGWKVGSNWQSIKIIANREASEIAIGSEAEFITEHYWGYAKVHNSKTYEYEVTHPRWLQYDVIGYKISIDFKANYGADFVALCDKEPFSVMLAEGSEITVENKKKIC